MRVTVDQDKCVSSGQCMLNASGVFDQRDVPRYAGMVEVEQIRPRAAAVS